MNRGFLIIAQNTSKVDYVQCATALAASIKKCMPQESITLVTTECPSNVSRYFDQVVSLPHGDLAPDSEWKLINDWQAYDASPYEYTLKLEADMIIPRSIDHWWEVLQHRDVVVSTTIRNFKQEISKSRAYRKFIDDNKLPDCYNALTYFNKSPLAKQFFAIVRDVFENWEAYRAILKCNVTEEVSTDWAYALASHLLGKEQTTMPGFTDMSMVHMKRLINDLPTEDWTDTLLYEILPDTLRINSCPQLYPVHYHVKHFSDKLIGNI